MIWGRLREGTRRDLHRTMLDCILGSGWPKDTLSKVAVRDGALTGSWFTEILPSPVAADVLPPSTAPIPPVITEISDISAEFVVSWRRFDVIAVSRTGRVVLRLTFGPRSCGWVINRVIQEIRICNWIKLTLFCWWRVELLNIIVIISWIHESKLFDRAAVIAARASDCLLAILTEHLRDNLLCPNSWHLIFGNYFSRKKLNFRAAHKFD